MILSTRSFVIEKRENGQKDENDDNLSALLEDLEVRETTFIIINIHDNQHS